MKHEYEVIEKFYSKYLNTLIVIKKCKKCGKEKTTFQEGTREEKK